MGNTIKYTHLKITTSINTNHPLYNRYHARGRVEREQPVMDIRDKAANTDIHSVSAPDVRRETAECESERATKLDRWVAARPRAARARASVELRIGAAPTRLTSSQTCPDTIILFFILYSFKNIN
ncbi:hypothetical protein EVAR_32811_1 [Eumeta japonica]|uniref:Uncharacterized protein n=1 Tax=Eumeta variegata TaxID=151549 RepID=A0A4C1WF80_EUMVA|nr:hypothetical protein EVAR_32811_1 [Eumeta japonica]